MFKVPYSTMPADCIVAWRDDKPIRNNEFQACIQVWRTKLEQTPNTKFAFYFNDSVEFASALWGAWLAGKTVYLASNTLSATCSALSKEVDGYIGEFPSEYAPISISSQDISTFLPSNDCINDFEGLVVYTSGSTGKPQIIPKRLSQLAAEVATLETLFGNVIGQAEIIATVSHQHIYGLLFKILWPLAMGRIIHSGSAVFLEEIIPLLTSRDCVLISSPAHLKRFPDSPALGPFLQTVAKHLRAVFSSGAALFSNTAHSIERLFGQAPIEVYGSSETGGIAWRQIKSTTSNKNNWCVMPGINWRVAEKGHLEIQSPHLPDKSWQRTNDEVKAIDTEHFVLMGRTDRIVKIEGKRVSLDAIERCLIASSFISQVRVILIDSIRSQRIAAFIVLNDEGKQSLQTMGKYAFNNLLRQTLAGSIERIALPRVWRYLEELPVNTQGKTTHSELMALLNDEVKVMGSTMPCSRLLQHDSEHAIIELTIPADLQYFKGHFRDIPVVPGVVQIDWAIHYGRQYFNIPPGFSGIRALKFQCISKPNMRIVLELRYDATQAILNFNFHSPMGQHASGRILFRNAT